MKKIRIFNLFLILIIFLLSSCKSERVFEKDPILAFDSYIQIVFLNLKNKIHFLRFTHLRVYCPFRSAERRSAGRPRSVFLRGAGRYCRSAARVLGGHAVALPALPFQVRRRKRQIYGPRRDNAVGHRVFCF